MFSITGRSLAGLSVRGNGIRNLCFAGACLAGLVATRCSQAEEESAPRAADAVEVSRPDTGAKPDFEATAEAASAANAPAADAASAEPAPNDAEATPNLLETNAAVSDFARKLSEKLKIAGPRKHPKPRPAWNAALSEEACPEDCPVCGAPLGLADDSPVAERRSPRWRKVPHVDWQFQDIQVEDTSEQNATKEKLQPGEPAQVILELREKLGNSAVNGTEFTVTPQQFAKWVRALDEEIHEQEAELPSSTLAPESVPVEYSAAADEATVSALRAASRQLDDAAELLEQQNLFERADELRDQADQLRRDARACLKQRAAPAANMRSERRRPSGQESVDIRVPLRMQLEEIGFEDFFKNFESRHPNPKPRTMPQPEERMIRNYFVLRR